MALPILVLAMDPPIQDPKNISIATTRRAREDSILVGAHLVEHSILLRTIVVEHYPRKNVEQPILQGQKVNNFVDSKICNIV